MLQHWANFILSKGKIRFSNFFYWKYYWSGIIWNLFHLKKHLKFQLNTFMFDDTKIDFPIPAKNIIGLFLTFWKSLFRNFFQCRETQKSLTTLACLLSWSRIIELIPKNRSSSSLHIFRHEPLRCINLALTVIATAADPR